MKRKNGFTLIELLAVIIILGILMIIAIPSVTQYINNSRKSAYVDTAKEIVAGARNFVNEGKLEMFSTDTTYYIPASCINTENGQKSPYGEFVQAYVLVTFNGKGYKYYWVSRDETGQGVKDPIEISELDEDSIESDIEIDYIKTNVTKDGTTNIKIIDEDGCNGFGKTAAEATLKTAQAAGQLNQIPGTDIYIFKGGNPNNYVTFNEESWRIIGIYGDQLKIQRVGAPEGLTAKKWNSSTPNPGWANSGLKTYLNETYYNSLSETAKNMIDENGSWNVGASLFTATAGQAYASATSTRTVGSTTHTTPWTGKVGLMASYEFLYASGGDGCDTVQGNYNHFNTTCGKASNDWMKPSTTIWTISSSSDDSTFVLVIYQDGNVVNGYLNDNNLPSFPAVILKPTVIIASGSGTQSNPYVLQ